MSQAHHLPGPPYHVRPMTEDVLDTWHVTPGPRVFSPEPSCLLCQRGLCVQFELPDDADIVMHGRWNDG